MDSTESARERQSDSYPGISAETQNIHGINRARQKTLYTQT